MDKTKETIYKMLIENTGVALMDSGGDNGRNWQRNQGKTLADFENEKPVEFDGDFETYTVSVFHYLSSILDIDDICDEFNTKFKSMKDWDSETYGVSKEAEKWLVKRMFEFGRSENTYNGENTLSQTVQYTPVNLGDRKYILVQIHGGADVRGGYTDAKLFYWPDNNGYGTDWAFIMGSPDVYGIADGKEISNIYDGANLRYEDSNEELDYAKVKEVKLNLAGF